MHYPPDEDPQALRNQLFRYAQDLQELMNEHHALQRRHFAVLQSRSREVLGHVNPFRAPTLSATNRDDFAAVETSEGEALTWRETITVWIVIFSCSAVLAGVCTLFWYRHIRG